MRACAGRGFDLTSGRLKTHRARPRRRPHRRERIGRLDARRLPRPCRDRCRALERAARVPAERHALRFARVPARPARLGQRRRQDRVGAALPAPRARRRAGRRVPALPQGPLVRRIRVRLGLGRRLPAPRPRLLPQAHRRDPVHAGARAPPAGDDARAAAACSCAASSSIARSAGLSSAHLLFLDDADQAAAREAGWSMRSTVAVPLAQPRARAVCRLRRLPGQPAAREAQEDPAGAAPRRRRRRQPSRVATGDATSRTTTGTSSTAATPSPTARTTPTPVPERATSSPARRRRWPHTGCSSPPGAAASASPAR